MAKKRVPRKHPARMASEKSATTKKSPPRASAVKIMGEPGMWMPAGARPSPDAPTYRELQAMHSVVSAEAERAPFRAPGGLLIGKPPIIAQQGNGKVTRAVGHGGVYRELPASLTDHEFYLRVLMQVLGKEWTNSQLKHKLSRRHIISRWLNDWKTLSREAAKAGRDEQGLFSAQATGNVKALLNLAYDVYLVQHCSQLPQRLVERLRSAAGFQGARYELAVASVTARAGFTLTWVPEQMGNKSPEFLASHRNMRDVFAVEAKSRHRLGVLDHERGKPPSAVKLKADITALLKDAAAKRDETYPLLIFIDVNQPTSPTTPDADSWIPDLWKRLSGRSIERKDSDEEFAALYVTNFAWHYLGDSEVEGEGQHVSAIPITPAIPLRDPRALDLIEESLNQYGIVPNSLPFSTFEFGS